MTHKQYLLIFAKGLFSGLLLWLILRKIDIGEIELRLSSVNLWWMLPAVVTIPAAILISAWRWQKLSLGLIDFWPAVRYTWIGVFFGTILPGFVGGDVAKCLSLASKDARMRDARLPISIVADKIVGFWVLLLLFCLSSATLLFLNPNAIPGVQHALLLAAFLASIGLFVGAMACQARGALALSKMANCLPSAKLREYSGRLLIAIGSLKGQVRLLWKAAAASLVLHCMNALAFWLWMRALSIPANLVFAAVFYPMLTFLLAVPLSISGVGVRDIFAATIFTAFGLNPTAGVAFSWLLLLLGVLNAIIGGCVQFWEMFRSSSAD